MLLVIPADPRLSVPDVGTPAGLEGFRTRRIAVDGVNAAVAKRRHRIDIELDDGWVDPVVAEQGHYRPTVTDHRGAIGGIERTRRVRRVGMD
jgi:hypothetical protein